MTGKDGTADPQQGESGISAHRNGDPDTLSSPIRHAGPLRIGILGAARIAEQAIEDGAVSIEVP